MAKNPFTKKTVGLKAGQTSESPGACAAVPFTRKAKHGSARSRKHEIPEGLWSRCPKCGELAYSKAVDENLKVCNHCDHHFPIGARERIHSLVETCSFQELDADMASVDVLHFTDTIPYPDRLRKNQEVTLLKDAVVTGIGSIGRHRTALGVLDFSFLAGSMGSVVGERVARLIETATSRQLPLVLISASGGARMQEGAFSLMQMAKVSGALAVHAAANLPFISVLADPTTGGVLASFASIGNLILAEPGAMIGFTGPRVFKDAAQTSLPPGFQTAEFLAEHGLIDAIVPRKEMKSQLCRYLDYLTANTESVA